MGRPRFNLPLKVALLERDVTGRKLAIDLRIGEIRFSHIVNQHATPTPAEQQAIAKYLHREVAALFPPPAPPRRARRVRFPTPAEAEE